MEVVSDQFSVSSQKLAADCKREAVGWAIPAVDPIKIGSEYYWLQDFFASRME
jgi:hypothetical protein